MRKSLQFNHIQHFFAAAPPPVRNLEIFEIDSVNKNVHLRWQEPQPPTNGEIRHYIVRNCDHHCRTLSIVTPVEYCTLWNEYMCAIVTRCDRFRKLNIKVNEFLIRNFNKIR